MIEISRRLIFRMCILIKQCILYSTRCYYRVCKTWCLGCVKRFRGFRGANRDQVSRKRVAELKREHEKQIHSLNNKIRELQVTLRKCSCPGGESQICRTIVSSGPSSSLKSYSLSKFSKWKTSKNSTVAAFVLIPKGRQLTRVDKNFRLLLLNTVDENAKVL